MPATLNCWVKVNGASRTPESQRSPSPSLVVEWPLESHTHRTLSPSVMVVLPVRVSWSAKIRAPCGPTSTTLVTASTPAATHRTPTTPPSAYRSSIGEPLESGRATRAPVHELRTRPCCPGQPVPVDKPTGPAGRLPGADERAGSPAPRRPGRARYFGLHPPRPRCYQRRPPGRPL